jgi:peptidoglycan/xylan/chitin deacetylase (PgdA/CDA1 family)
VFAEAFAGSVGGAAALMAYAVRGPSSTLLGPSVSHGSRQRRAIAVTFDDGPSESTEAVLDILQKHQVPATFFVCGSNVARLPKVAHAVKDAGHEIGNHSHTHPRLYLRSRGTIKNEFQIAQETITETIGSTPHLMRPPFGIRWFGFREMQRELNLLGVMWTVIGLDWKLSSRAISRRLQRGACNGAIFCLHDGRGLSVNPDISQTLKALDESLPAILDRGYRFETVSQLICPKN